MYSTLQGVGHQVVVVVAQAAIFISKESEADKTNRN